MYVCMYACMFSRSIASQVILSLHSYPDAIRAQGLFYSPPIIRDRAGAIRPDFSVRVESRCTLVGRASTVIACLSRSLPESGKGVGGHSFGLLGRRSAAISVGAFLTRWDLTHYEPVWLAQNVAILTWNCSGDLSPYRRPLIHLVFELRLTPQTRSVWQVARQTKCMYVCMYVFIHRERDLDIHTHTCMHMIYIYIYIHM